MSGGEGQGRDPEPAASGAPAGTPPSPAGRVKKGQVSLAFRLWVLSTVFVWPFIDDWEVVVWAVLGAGLALWWRSLPEDPPEPPPRLPYQHLYGRQRDK